MEEDVHEKHEEDPDLHTEFFGFFTRLHSGMYDRIHDVCIYD